LFNLTLKPFFFCFISFISFTDIAVAQTPVITPKSNVVIPLDQTGGFTIIPGTIANITDTISGHNLVTITPSTLSCADVGTKNITISAVNTIANPSAVTFANIVGMESDPAKRGCPFETAHFYSQLYKVKVKL